MHYYEGKRRSLLEHNIQIPVTFGRRVATSEILFMLLYRIENEEETISYQDPAKRLFVATQPWQHRRPYYCPGWATGQTVCLKTFSMEILSV